MEQPPPQLPAVCGILPIDKPAGPSSARVVTRVKYMLPRGTKVGHAGTLDPFATGVLLVLVGRPATKLSGSLMASPKQYVATIRLGVTTASFDPEKPEVPVEGASPVERARLEDALAAMTGTVLQRPPAFSAVRIAGRQSYKLARKGSAVEPEARPVRIDRIDLLSYDWPDAVVRIDCGKGTYIRAIARDLGETLGVGGYLAALRRTRVGPYTAEASVPFDALTAESLPGWLQPPASPS